MPYLTKEELEALKAEAGRVRRMYDEVVGALNIETVGYTHSEIVSRARTLFILSLLEKKGINAREELAELLVPKITPR